MLAFPSLDIRQIGRITQPSFLASTIPGKSQRSSVSEGSSLRLRAKLIWPLPFHDFRFVDAVFVGVAAAGYLLVFELILGVSTRHFEFGHAIDNVDRNTEAVNLVANRQLKRCVDASLLFVTAHVQIVVVVAAVSQTMDHPGIGMEIEDDRLIEREQAVKVAIGQTVWMLCIRLQPEEIHHV